LSEYTFGDSDIARERLAVLAEVFAPTTDALLSDLRPTFVRYVLDLGCGPGHTTAQLRAAFPLAEITGFDASAVMIEAARARVPRATFAVYDVTQPLLLPADIVFARFLLGHLPDTDAAQATWTKSLRPGSGLLVCEEPVGYLSDDPWFARYEQTVTAIVAATGATLWAASALDRAPDGCERVLDRVVEHPVTAAQAGALFWRNAAQWRDQTPDGDALLEHFRAVEQSGSDEPVIWQMRQVAFRKQRA
jgi:trans-aconitate 2-methyltransferase